MTVSTKLMAVMLAGATLATAVPASAEVTDVRQANQARRINDGIRSGALTPREVAKLDAEQAAIRAREARAKADGIVTPRERAELAYAQNRASNNIFREKHDYNDRRYGQGPRWGWRKPWWKRHYGNHYAPRRWWN